MAGVGLEVVFTGHDHYVYEVTKTYSGAGFIHIAKGPQGVLVGSPRISHISFHIDDIDEVIAALQVLKGK